MRRVHVVPGKLEQLAKGDMRGFKERGGGGQNIRPSPPNLSIPLRPTLLAVSESSAVRAKRQSQKTLSWTP